MPKGHYHRKPRTDNRPAQFYDVTRMSEGAIRHACASEMAKDEKTNRKYREYIFGQEAKIRSLSDAWLLGYRQKQMKY
jgi:hypothetical protein